MSSGNFRRKGRKAIKRREPLLGNRFVWVDEHCTFGADALYLASFAAPSTDERVCDLGTGSGILPLLFHSGNSHPCVDAVELCSHAAALARESVEQNGLSAYIRIREQDWNDLSAEDGVYNCIVCNPPYFAAGSGKQSRDAARRLARHETATTLDDICRAAERLLPNGGRFCLCHRPERLADVFAALRAHHLEPKRLQWVHDRPSSSPFLFLCEAVRNGNPHLTVLPPLFDKGECVCPAP